MRVRTKLQILKATNTFPASVSGFGYSSVSLLLNFRGQSKLRAARCEVSSQAETAICGICDLVTA